MTEQLQPQKELAWLMSKEDSKGKKILLHSCCAPCSSYCLLYLSACFEITVYYYNPNITEEFEFRKRAKEQQRLIEEYNRFAKLGGGKEAREEAARLLQTLPDKHPELISFIRDRLAAPRFQISYIEGEYEPDRFYAMARGLEKEPERGRRCQGCYGLRLGKTAALAEETGGFDYFATTLTLSPLKDAAAINRIGRSLEGGAGPSYLPTDFKKNNGYLLSILLSEVFGLYRQNYCGCEFSRESGTQ